MKRILLFTFSLVVMLYNIAAAQSVMNPADPLVRYNSNTPPTEPAWGQMGKWVATNRNFNWDGSSYKAYIYKNVAFRVKFPKTYQHGVADGKKYPVFLFFHGRGEWGTKYDNENQLYHGGKLFRDAADAGKFDGFLLYPQNTSGYWGDAEYGTLTEILQYMSDNVKADPNRVSVNGLSAGGGASWEFMLKFPRLVAASLPMSGVGWTIPQELDKYKFTPVWLFQGGKDGAPSPYTAEQVVNASKAGGANITYTLFPNLGHDVWYEAWGQANFFPFISKANLLTPWPLHGRAEFCNGDPINITIGVPPGFNGYEWRKDGNPIAGNTNQIQVTSLGVYSVRVQRGTVWSEWSPEPLEVKIKPSTQTPPIVIAGLQSNVIPAPDGNTGVKLRLPNTFVTYEWKSVATSQVVGTDSTVTISVPGDYIARVNELYGCASNYSAPYTVINANGPNKPDPISGLSTRAVSQTEIELTWADKPNPTHNETLFEVYRGTKAGGPYQLVAKVPADVLTYTDGGLLPNITYYYIIRPVNNTGAAPVSAEVTGESEKDNEAPAAPANLRVSTVTNTSIGLTWNAATDDVAIGGYEVFVNGSKAYTLGKDVLSVNAYGLVQGQVYNFYVRAKDISGNFSSPSNQVTAKPGSAGFNYKYYEGTWSNLPNFGTLTPKATGKSMNVTIAPRQRNDLFAFLWEGYIKIPVTGTYTFQINSDDGSKLFVNAPYSYSATPLINNDGLHGATAKSASITLNAGTYPISASFFERDGGEVMELTWKCAELGITNFEPIPDGYFSDVANPGGGAVPAAPEALGAVANTYKSISVSWQDMSNNETGFEIYRSTSKTGTFGVIAVTPANSTQYEDKDVAPNTRYYYKIRAVGATGESALSTGYDYKAIWPLNNSTEDVSYTANTMATNATSYSTTAQEGSHAMNFNGTSSYATIGGSASGTLLHEAFSERTVALWIKAASLTNNRIIVDLGGSDRGMALRISSSKLQAAIANTNGFASRTSVTTDFTNTNWTHVAASFKNGSLKLYVNGVLAASTTASFSTVTATSSNSRLGVNNGNNAFNDNGTYYSGLMDQVVIVNKELTAADLTKLMANTLPMPTAATTGLPAVPAVPTGLGAQTLSANSIKLNWSANPANASGIEIQRSIGNESNYKFLAKIDSANASGSDSYTDTALFANLQYFYKVKTLGDGGSSAFSASANATTLNSKPVVSSISNSVVRFGTSLNIPVNATDPDGDNLTFSTVSALPAFLSMVQNGSSVSLQGTPAEAQQGVYSISVIAADNNNGKDTATFTLTVNDNYSPVIADIAPVNATEATPSTATVNLVDEHNEGKTFTWEGVDLPGFVTVTGSNTSATVNVNASLIDAGTYTVTLKVTDNKGGTGTKSFTLNVAEKDPTDKIFVKFLKSYPAPAPWNNVTGVTTNNLLDASGNATNVDLLIQGNWFMTNNDGPVTWYDNGVYIDAVLRDYYFFGKMTYYFDGPPNVDMKFAGLEANRKYSFRLYGGTCFWAAADNGHAIYTIGNETRQLAVQNNKTNTVSIDNVTPDANGEILLQITKPADQIIGVINAIEITATLDDGTPPAAPKSLAGSLDQVGDVNLSWTDIAYNEDNYKVYRGADSLGTYSLLATLNSNVVSFKDTTVTGNNQYFYKIVASNTAGASAASNIFGISLPNLLPLVDSIADVKLKAGQSTTVNVVAKDDATDVVTLTATGVPSFGTFTDNGSGNGQFSFSPGNDNLGTFNITLKATDSHGGISTRAFRVFVSDKKTTLTYINFADIAMAPAPWNNVSYPFAGVKLSNAKDESGTTTNIGLELMETWSWSITNGVNGTENAGIYPDVVVRSSFYQGTNDARTIRITGLPSGKKFNFVFFNSQDFGADATTRFSIGAQSVLLNASFNTNKTVQINGIVPSSGNVDIVVKKEASATNAYISALVIEAYDDTVALVSPGSLRATAKSGTAVDLMWADRADNETGYEVWTALSAAGPYTLKASLAANTTTYSVTGLSPNTRYYYKVRAKKNSYYSDFSNSANVTTFGMQMFINFTENSIAAAPWNNTIQRPQLGPWVANLKDATGAATSVGLELLISFENKYIRGINTGNNSGVYPDMVNIESFLMYQGKSASIKISGLNQQMAYNFTFFASSDEWNEFTSKYTLNKNRVTYLNASMNKYGTTTLFNVKPDANGEIIFDIDPAYNNTILGLIGALVIDGYVPPAEEQQAPGGQQARIGTVAAIGNNGNNVVSVSQNNDVVNGNLGDVKVYPNPIRDYVNVDVQLSESSNLTLEIFDASGRIMQRDYRSNVAKGATTLRVNTSNTVRTPGIYMLKVSGKPGSSKTIKIIKQ